MLIMRTQSSWVSCMIWVFYFTQIRVEDKVKKVKKGAHAVCERMRR